MRDSQARGSLAGMLLLAHPALSDKNFRRTVVLLAAHDPDSGAMGVILNRPMGRSLGEAVEGFSRSALGGVPLYQGGPVETDRVLFAAWRRDASQRRLQVHFGIDRDTAERLLRESPETSVRAFLGHSGWSSGQLEGELKGDGWIVRRPDFVILSGPQGVALWRELLNPVSPQLRLLADAPDEPGKN